MADEKDLAGLSASFFPELPVVLRPHTRYEPFDGLIIMAGVAFLVCAAQIVHLSLLNISQPPRTKRITVVVLFLEKKKTASHLY